MADLSIIIVSYNVRQYLLPCIDSVIETCRELDHEIIVADNSSGDGSARAVKEQFPRVVVIANKNNAGFAKANNQGHEISTGDYILLLNPDTVAKPGAIKTVLDFMKATPEAGLAGCRMVGEDGSLQRTAKRMPSVTGHLIQALFLDKWMFPENRKAFYYGQRPVKIGYPNGAFMMVRRNALKGGPILNEDYFMYAEEKDLALRLKQNGYDCYFVPGAEIVHYGGKSTDQLAIPMYLVLQKSQVKYFNKYYTGTYKRLLIWSYWLVLLTHFCAALVLPFTKYGRGRIKLLFNAVIKYPEFVNA